MSTPVPTNNIFNDQICGTLPPDGKYLNKFPQYCCDSNNPMKTTYQCHQYKKDKIRQIENKDTGSVSSIWEMNGKIWNTIATDKNKMADTWAEMTLFKYKMPLQTLMQGNSLIHEMAKEDVANIMKRYQARASEYFMRTKGVDVKPKDISSEDLNTYLTESTDKLESGALSGEITEQMENDAYNALSLQNEYDQARTVNEKINNPVSNLIEHIVMGFMFGNMVLEASNADSIESAAVGGALAGMGDIERALIGAGTSVALYELGIGKNIGKLQKFKSTILNKKTIDYLGNLYKGSYAMGHRSVAIDNSDPNKDWGNLRDEQLDWPLELDLDFELISYFNCDKLSTSDCKNGTILYDYCTPCDESEDCKCKYNPNNKNGSSDYDTLHEQYYYEYINNLKYNSNGDEINPILGLSDLDFLMKILTLSSQDPQSMQYTKWDLFLQKYAKFILFALMCICIFCYILKNRILKKNIK